MNQSAFFVQKHFNFHSLSLFHTVNQIPTSTLIFHIIASGITDICGIGFRETSKIHHSDGGPKGFVKPDFNKLSKGKILKSNGAMNQSTLYIDQHRFICMLACSYISQVGNTVCRFPYICVCS